MGFLKRLLPGSVSALAADALCRGRAYLERGEHGRAIA